MPTSVEPLIASVKVAELFGMYSYDLPPEGTLQNAAILYGENGLGKTTILRMVYYLLSPAVSRAHRTKLYEIPFNSLVVELSSGVTIAAKRESEDLSGMLSLTIARGGETIAAWEFEPTPPTVSIADTERYIDSEGRLQHRLLHSHRSRDIKSRRGQEAYLSTLSDIAPMMYMLTADRRLDSDAVADPSDELELRRMMRYEEPRHLSDVVVRSREIALSQALGSAAQFIRTKALQSANRGSMNVHSVYLNVIHQLAARRKRGTETSNSQNADVLLEKLTAIEAKTRELARYELATPLSTSELREALRSQRDQSRRDLAASLLAPYIDSLEGRLEATEPIYRIVDRLVTTINRFLTDKSLGFRLSQGFTIQSRLGLPLGPAQLSSGEQQLLLLFCYILTGRDRPSVFMIDEPEISLNVKWQRQLVQALLDIAEDSPTQFVFASHSMELLAQHRSRVVRLENTQ